MEIFNNEDAIKYIKAKLNLDWCVLECDLEIASVIEPNVESDDFNIIMFGGMIPVIICKKTNALKNLLGYSHDDFDNVIVMTFVRTCGGESIRYTGFHPDYKSDVVDAIIEKLNDVIVEVK